MWVKSNSYHSQNKNQSMIHVTVTHFNTSYILKRLLKYGQVFKHAQFEYNRIHLVIVITCDFYAIFTETIPFASFLPYTMLKVTLTTHSDYEWSLQTMTDGRIMHFFILQFCASIQLILLQKYEHKVPQVHIMYHYQQ